MGQPADAKLTPAIARELCQRTGSAAVLDGSIAQIGTQYLVILKAVNCASGESLASTEAQASDKNHVLDALGKTASEIRNKLGESLSTVQKFDTPLDQATTPSLEALKAFSSGHKNMFTKGATGAIPFFKQAIELDPNFAIVYAWLGRAYRDLERTPCRRLQPEGLRTPRPGQRRGKVFHLGLIRYRGHGKFAEGQTNLRALDTGLSSKSHAAHFLVGANLPDAWTT